MILYCIIHQMSNITNIDTYELLEKAANARGVEFVPIEADNFDYAHGVEALDAGASVYRLAGGSRAAILELMMVGKGMKGLYIDSAALLARQFNWGSALRIQQAGLPVIPSIYNVSRNEDARLKSYVEELGGFPVILKASGGSHGAGVMKVDSLSSLRSILAYTSTEDSSDLILRKFIDSARHIRLVVLGDRVIDAIEYDVQPDDFRTNAVSVPTVVDRNDIDDSIKALAVHAVAAQNLEFGGVDILVDKQGDPYVAEVNFPCNFARNQLNTGTNIAEQMVDYLRDKSGAVS